MLLGKCVLRCHWGVSDGLSESRREFPIVGAGARTESEICCLRCRSG